MFKAPFVVNSELRTFLNHEKVYWPKFKEFSKIRFREISKTSDVRVAKVFFSKSAGRLPETGPNFPGEAAGLVYELLCAKSQRTGT